jgi:putative ABC transport system permease protein
MNLTEMVLSAWTSLMSNKLRSFLTMLGILIGVASIIAIVAIGRGGKAAIVSIIQSNRAQQTIQIIPTELVQPGLPQPGQVLSFSTQDFDIARQFSGVQSVYYTLSGQGVVDFGGKQVTASLNAGPSYMDELSHFVVVQGRMFSNVDVIARRRVGLVSQSLAKKLFGNTSPVGKVVTIGGYPMEVVGVTASTQFNLLSGIFGSDTFYFPATTAHDLFPWWDISEMDVQVAQGVNKTAMAHQIVAALNINAHNAQAFEDASGFLVGVEQTVGKITAILTLIIGAIAGIALLVGGVGVMNIMLVSVTERTGEIGIRMSLGATRRAILLQFLIEAVMITVLGGALGILIGVIGAQIVSWVTKLHTEVSWFAVLVGFLFSIIIGVLCGLYPANKASKLNPIDALRYE